MTNGNTSSMMWAGFQLPDNGVPIIAEWDRDEKTLQFDVENYSDCIEHCPKDILDEAVKWCQQNSANCDTEERANEHLQMLGIKERLEVW